MRYGRLFSALAVASLPPIPWPRSTNLRAANGMPAGIVENPAWSADCAAHMRYLELNDFRGNWHTEVPGPARLHRGRATRPPAARCSPTRRRVGLETNWEDCAVPLRPAARAEALACPGYADGCIYTWPGYRRPGAAGAASCTPIPATACADTTSPYLYVSASAAGRAGATLSDASLTGPRGPDRAARRRQPHRGRRGLPAAGRHPRPRRAARRTTALHRPGHVHLRRGGARGQALELPHRRRWARRQKPYRRGRADRARAPRRRCPRARTPGLALDAASRRAQRRPGAITARGLTVGRRARVSVRRLDCTLPAASTRTMTLTSARRGGSRRRQPGARHGQRRRASAAARSRTAGLTLTQSLS